MAHPDPAVVGDVWKAPVRWQNAQRMNMIVEACMMMFGIIVVGRLSIVLVQEISSRQST